MADTQFRPLGTLDAPADWVLPTGLQIEPKACFASYDGTGAAGAFLPCLTIIDDAGRTVGRYPAASVAAGASVDASWFPRVAAAAAAAPAPPASTQSWALQFGATKTVAAATTAYLSGQTGFGTNFYTNDAAIFTSGTIVLGGITYTGVVFNKVGHYLVRCDIGVAPAFTGIGYQLKQPTTANTGSYTDGIGGSQLAQVVTATDGTLIAPDVSWWQIVSVDGSTYTPPTDPAIFRLQNHDTTHSIDAFDIVTAVYLDDDPTLL